MRAFVDLLLLFDCLFVFALLLFICFTAVAKKIEDLCIKQDHIQLCFLQYLDFPHFINKIPRTKSAPIVFFILNYNCGIMSWSAVVKILFPLHLSLWYLSHLDLTSSDMMYISSVHNVCNYFCLCLCHRTKIVLHPVHITPSK